MTTFSDNAFGEHALEPSIDIDWEGLARLGREAEADELEEDYFERLGREAEAGELSELEEELFDRWDGHARLRGVRAADFKEEIRVTREIRRRLNRLKGRRGARKPKEKCYRRANAKVRE